MIYVKKSTNDSDVISLFESLDGYIQFRDQYHVQKALEVNDPDKKTENQITDQTREDPSLKNSRTAASKSTKNTQAVSESEDRRDFPEVSPTAMSEFICKKCAKSFQNNEDLVRHTRFEEGQEKGREISEKSRTDRQRTIAIDPKHIEGFSNAENFG